MKNKICIVLFKNISSIFFAILITLLISTNFSNLLQNFFTDNQNTGIKIAVIIILAIYILSTSLKTLYEIADIKNSTKQ